MPKPLPDFEGGVQPVDRPAPTYEEFIALEPGNIDLPDHVSLGRLRWHGAAAWRGICRASGANRPERMVSLLAAKLRLDMIEAMEKSGKVGTVSCAGDASSIIGDTLYWSHVLRDSIANYILCVEGSADALPEVDESPEFDIQFPLAQLAAFRALLDKLPHPPGKS